MEASVVHAVAAILTVFLASRAIWHVVWRPYTIARCFERQGIRGPPYRFVVGSLWEIRRIWVASRAKAPLDTGCHDYPRVANPFFHKCFSDYGKTFLYWLGPIPAICSSDIDLVKQVLEDRTGLFPKDYLNPSLEIIFGKGVIFANGEDWKRHRKIVYPIFHTDNLKAMASEGAQKMIEQWCAQMEKQGDGHQAEIDMAGWSEELTLEVIGRVIFSKTYREVREAFVAGKELHELAFYALSDPPIPGFRYLPTPRNIRSWKLDKLIKMNITQLIKARHKVSGQVLHRDDLLGLMLQSCGPEAETLSTEEIIGECKTFLGAGQDTSANLLTWGMFLLSRYPEWQDKIREEVLRECRDDSEVIDLGKLKLLNMFLLETLRLYSPVPFLMRQTASDTTLANIKVPRGTVLMFPIATLHRSKEVWGLDADKFNPTRFERGSSRAAKYPHAMLAFSHGPRVCAGKNFAMVQVQTVMAMILTRFSFSLSPRYVHMPKNFISLVPRYGLPLLVRSRQLDRPENHLI